MENKFTNWTITVINDEGIMYSMEPQDKEEALEWLKELQQAGQNMDDVNVFAPNSNLTMEEIISYEQ